MEREEPYLIIRDGIRAGTFQNEQDAKEAMTMCNDGYIIKEEEWEKRTITKPR